ncbi:hypothetical protein G7B40_007295 [Aetokthonos hydrillicola Thurmond2011]|jgi:hypothetical protein|uniref:Uncharacterized protein n=1 Tax=Aetokthonos hydrillicola Thurmond2011 TaxID=2712845 RepID=A0AAP5I439_9CYAN|nr:hypothetical protein [Aetokthonos hydrillicola]MBO3459302.1 hypothetical protein [Aetokthonos hydrillicola CCALA 1050]MBW4587728.1 hypothetical protein [Aetokthonos hydrillicola CCALA 1050]MDR9894376.1 hypothetical protein [Aetokthonos hydrillicola Thurmond2011]
MKKIPSKEYVVNLDTKGIVYMDYTGDFIIFGVSISIVGLLFVRFIVQKFIKSPSAKILVLVINAEQENILENLKITEDNAEILYRAARALWVGSEQDFNNHFKSWFDQKMQVKQTEQSEHDVYLVKIFLKKPDSSFQPKKSSLQRLDAFQRLPKNLDSRAVLVSPRLSSAAYGIKCLYKR